MRVYGYQGDLILRDNAATGEVTEYIAAGGMTMARIKGSSVTYPHSDHLGTPVVATDASGAILWREAETPYGEPWLHAAANDNDRGFTGHIEDTATGLTYMQARYYDPVIGQFLSTDPVQFSTGKPFMFGRYLYAANDPVNMIDPDGRTPLGLSPAFREETLKYLTPEERALVREAEFLGGMAALSLLTGGTAAIPLRMAALRSVAPRGFAQARNLIQETTKGFARTSGKSGKRTFQSFGQGGQKGADKLFNALTRGQFTTRDGVRLGRLGDGSRVQISSRTLKDGTKETSVRISRQITGSRIRENIKIRFREQAQ